MTDLSTRLNALPFPVDLHCYQIGPLFQASIRDASCKTSTWYFRPGPTPAAALEAAVTAIEAALKSPRTPPPTFADIDDLI